MFMSALSIHDFSQLNNRVLSYFFKASCVLTIVLLPRYRQVLWLYNIHMGHVVYTDKVYVCLYLNILFTQFISCETCVFISSEEEINVLENNVYDTDNESIFQICFLLFPFKDLVSASFILWQKPPVYRLWGPPILHLPTSW